MKNSYSVVKTFRESYTGGEIAWEDQSQCLLCPTDSKLNLISKTTGLIVSSLNEVSYFFILICLVLFLIIRRMRKFLPVVDQKEK